MQIRDTLVLSYLEVENGCVKERQSMTLKKILIAALACMLACFASVAIVGCTPDAETLIKDAITKEFDTYKNMDDSAIEHIATSAENQDLSSLGIDNTEFATIVLDGFDYSIDKITVDADMAYVDMTIVSKSSSAFEEQLTSAIDELQNSAHLSTMSEEDRVQAIGDAVMSAFQGVPTISENVTVEYQLIDGTWTPINTADTLGALDSVVFAQS